MSNSEKPKQPDPESDGFFVKTLNAQGFMGAYPSDPFMRAFIEYSAHASGPVLDVGAAYGVATLPALKKGATVWANDLDPRHLEILKEKAGAECGSRLTLLPGSFPHELNIQDQTLGAVLIARVLHFFTGPQIEEAVTKMFAWLKKGGKVFATAETPYLKNLQSFIPEYEKRIAAGDLWPGFIADFVKVDQRKGANLPQSMHFLDPIVFRRVFENAGFQVEEVRTFARPEFPETLRLDGRESVGIIAVKK